MEKWPEKNPYQVLGVIETCENETLTAVYKQLAKKHHPDKGGLKERFQEISEAYEYLKNPENRERYDRKLRETRERFKESVHESVYEDDLFGAYRDGGGPAGFKTTEEDAKEKLERDLARQTNMWREYAHKAPKVKHKQLPLRYDPDGRTILYTSIAAIILGGLRILSHLGTLDKYAEFLDKHNINAPVRFITIDALMWGLAGWVIALCAAEFIIKTTKTETRAWIFATSAGAAGVLAKTAQVRPWAYFIFGMVGLHFLGKIPTPKKKERENNSKNVYKKKPMRAPKPSVNA
jgi:hypothetical protein